MNKGYKKSLWLIIMVIISCIAMAIVEIVIEPTYFVKSAIKVILFLLVPFIFIKLQKKKVFEDSFSLDKRKLLKLLGLGLIIYVIIMVAFFLTKGIFDYSSLVNSLSDDQNVSQNSFLRLPSPKHLQLQLSARRKTV